MRHPPSTAAAQAAADARRVIETVMSYRAAKILLVAVHFDLFTAIQGGARTPAALCRRLGTDPRATRILLDSLAALGFLRKTGDAYRNAPASGRVLVSGRPGYLGNNLKYQELLWEAWSDLKHVVRTGKNRRPLEFWLFRHDTFTREYILGMHNIAREPARQIAGLVPAGGARALLDVGAGPGSYALAFLERHPSLKACLLDLPATVRVARGLLKSHPLTRRVEFRQGDYTRVPFGREEFDMILMSHITHNEGEAVNRRLLKKAFQALRPGGRVLIHDFMVSPDRTAPAFGALFSVHMLVSTKAGRVYSAQEYGAWLRDAGFVRIKKYDVAKKSPNASTLLAASRPVR